MDIQEKEKKTQRKNKFSLGTTLMIIGVVLLLSSFGIVVFNGIESANAEKASAETVEQLREESNIIIEESDESLVAVPVKQIDGEKYVGILEIPDLKLTLPVTNDWSYKKLKKGPCVFSGSYFTNDLVIIGHNYRSVFSPVRNIKPNTDVYLTTADNRVLHYVVDYAETLSPSSVDELVVKGNWDLTLLTCNIGGQTRKTVRCILVND